MRLFGGEPSRVTASAGFADGLDMRFAALVELPGRVTGSFDVALDLPRTDELELIGTEGTLRLPDPWICRSGHVELVRKGQTERIAVDPAGRHGLTGAEADPYRIEIAAVNAAITGDAPLEFGPGDAIAQATAYQAMIRSAKVGQPIAL